MRMPTLFLALSRFVYLCLASFRFLMYLCSRALTGGCPRRVGVARRDDLEGSGARLSAGCLGGVCAV